MDYIYIKILKTNITTKMTKARTYILILMLLVLFINLPLNFVNGQQRGQPRPSIEKHNPPKEKSVTVKKTFPVNGVSNRKKQSDENNSLIQRIKEARKSGNRFELNRLQSKLNEINGIRSQQGEIVGYVKQPDKQSEGRQNINVSLIHYGIDVMSIATVTEQRGVNTGRIWTVEINNVNSAIGPTIYSEARFYYSDDQGVNWFYYAYAYNEYESASIDEIDAEIIEDFTGTKYLYVAYGAQSVSSGKYVCNLITLDISGTVNGIVQHLEFPGFDYYSDIVGYYKPRITTDNAFWNGGAYLYIAVCQDSANGTDYDFSEKVALITNPYTSSPSVDYRPYYFWYFSADNGFHKGNCDIAWFDDPNNGGGSILLVESGAFYTTALYLYESPDVGFLTTQTYEGYLDADTLTKSSAYIAGNGLYENLMIVNVSEFTPTDHDIQFFSTTNAGVGWSMGFVSYTLDDDYRADIAGMRNVPGNFYSAHADYNSSFDNVFYSIAVNDSWGPLYVPLNTIDASVDCSPRPGIKLDGNDSCFAVWTEWNGNSNVWASGGCSGNMMQSRSLDLGVLIEGFYTPYGMTRSDSVTVSLRNTTSPYGIVESKKLNISAEGYLRANYFTISDTTDYYVVVNHRNALETWSAYVINFTGGNFYSYQFISNNTLAFGDNEKYLGTDSLFNDYYGIYSGDVNQDETIDLSDISIIYNEANLFVSGYVPSDVNGDDFVDLTDLTIAFNNAIAFVSVIKP